MNYDLVIFDWDGTLMDSIQHIVVAMQGAVLLMDAEPRSESAIRDIIGLGLSEAISELFPDESDDFVQILAAHYRDQYLANDHRSSLLTATLPTLLQLQTHGLKLAVATGKSRRGLDRVISKENLLSFFHATRTADETLSKPDPRMVNEILSELAVSPDRALMVGDSVHDIEMARRAGIAAVGITQGVHDAGTLSNAGAFACIDELHELMPLILK